MRQVLNCLIQLACCGPLPSLSKVYSTLIQEEKVVVLEVKESLVGKLHARVNVGHDRDDIVCANVALTVRASANASA
ncbi:hypothetical protein CR513_44059, partial [Mucuna pruriens]